MANSRLLFLDIAKSICIILIVWAHSGGLLSYPLLMLTVPCFFVISGYLHNSNNNFFEFFRKKFFRLYLPFVCCNLFLPLLTLIKRYSLGLDIKQNIIYIFKIVLTLSKDGFLFGATWFLGSLFVISVLTKSLEYIFKNQKFRYVFIGIICLFIIILSETIFNIEQGIRRTIIGLGFYVIGLYVNLYAENIKRIYNAYKYLFISVLIPAIFISFHYVLNFNYGSKSVVNLVCFTVISLCYAYFILFISKILEKYKNLFVELLSFVGKRTLSILLWQFVFFEIINVILLKINGVSLTVIEKLPHTICNSAICILIYFIAGLFGPLILSFLYSRINLKFIK